MWVGSYYVWKLVLCIFYRFFSFKLNCSQLLHHHNIKCTFYFRRNKKYVYWNMVVRCTIFRDHEQGFFTFIQFTYSFSFFFWRLPSKYTYIYTEWRSRIAMLTMKYINTAHELLKVMLENHNLVEYFVGLNRNDAADPTTGPGRIARLSLPNVDNI